MNACRKVLSALIAAVLCLHCAALAQGLSTYSFAEFGVDVPGDMVVFTHDNLTEDHPYADVYDMEFIRQAAFADRQHYLLAIPVDYAQADEYFEIHVILASQGGVSGDLLEGVASGGGEAEFLDSLVRMYLEPAGANVQSAEMVSIDGKLWISLYGTWPEESQERHMHQYMTYIEHSGGTAALTLRADAWSGEGLERADACLDAVAHSLRIHGGDAEQVVGCYQGGDGVALKIPGNLSLDVTEDADGKARYVWAKDAGSSAMSVQIVDSMDSVPIPGALMPLLEGELRSAYSWAAGIDGIDAQIGDVVAGLAANGLAAERVSLGGQEYLRYASDADAVETLVYQTLFGGRVYLFALVGTAVAPEDAARMEAMLLGARYGSEDEICALVGE